jgi:hypothetical protein
MLSSIFLHSQVTISPWKMNKGGGIIYYNVGFHGNPTAYSKANIPSSSASGWTTAPTNSNGEINYSVRSILSRCLSQLDFTYFETFIDIPLGYVINDLNVKFSAADDGARAYIFNSDHPNGAYIGEIRLGQTPVTANYANLAKAGKKNRLVIVQFDDCPTGNNLTGAQVKVNGEVAPISNLSFNTNNTSCTYSTDGNTTVNVTGGQGPFTYLWSNGQTTNTATNLTVGTYTVTVTDGLNRINTGTVTINTQPGPDNDNDGVSDACDDDDDNDGILDIDECINSNFHWSSPPTKVDGSGRKIFSGQINGINYEYSSSKQINTTPQIYAHSIFPSSYNVPNQTSIQNIEPSSNTLTFDQPMTNPVLVFSSIGQRGIAVPITFSAPVEILWSKDVIQNSSTQITGREGYTIVRLNGTYSSISFDYLTYENYVNFAFGADFFTYCDTDSDGTADVFDTDSDNDGCPDAIEAGYLDPNSDGIPGTSTAVNSRGRIQLNHGSGQNNYIISIPNAVTNNEINGCNEPPIAKAKDIIVFADENCSVSILNNALDDGSSDPDGDELTFSLSSNGPFSVGEHTVTMTVTDTKNESDSAIAVVTVIDNTSPSVITQNITIELNSKGNATITSAQINNNSFDNCGIESMELDVTTFSCNDIGNNTVNLTVTDINGNSDSASAVVIVKDNIAPIVNTKNISIPLINGEANITAENINDGTIDNCDFTLSLNRESFFCSDIGDHTITLTATDSSGNYSSKTAIVTIEGAIPEVTISDFTAVNTQKENTIFLGYGPQSINLSTSVIGGEDFTYQWTSSNNDFVDNVANPKISPTTSATYTVVVTNNYGCTTTASIEVCVMDARSYNKKGKATGKVLVCHHTNGKKGTKHVMINISSNAVMQHLTNHGVGTSHADKLGACDATCITGNTTIMTSIESNDNNLTDQSGALLVYPNPSKGMFEIQFSNMKKGTEFNLIDYSGRLIDRKILSADSDQKISIGNNQLPIGIYFLRIISSDETIIKKLIVNKD